MTVFVNTLSPSVFPQPGVRSGTIYYVSPLIQTGSTANGISPSLAMYQPFCLPGMAIDRIGVETTVGSGNCRLGIYTNNNGLPDRLILDAGAVSVAGVAINEITLASTLYLPNAWVWVCGVCDGNPTCRTGTSQNIHLIGASSTSSATVRGLTATLAYGALPSTASLVSLANAAAVPMYLLRKS